MVIEGLSFRPYGIWFYCCGFLDWLPFNVPGACFLTPAERKQKMQAQDTFAPALGIKCVCSRGEQVVE
jgi:hypothetical protein